MSSAAAILLELAALPGAILLAAMASGVVFALMGATIRVPPLVFLAAQAIVGCLVARSITLSIITSIAHDWPIMLLVVAATVLSSAMVGYALVRLKVLPGSTAAWGSAPGGASVMVVMAEEFGADPRLVAFMQYLRVIAIAFVASLIARLWFGAAATPALAPAAEIVAPTDVVQLLLTLIVALASVWLGLRLKVPAAGVMMPMAVGAVLQGTGLFTITLPHWLLAVTYFGIGWAVGLRFDREVTAHAFRAIPAMLAAIAVVMGLCGLWAFMLVVLVGTDPLTAYLATSPGGLDTIAIIAVGSTADVPFVLALQTLRLVLVVVTGPALARLIARVSGR
jgi:membrane AbrB-like protein